MTESAEEHPPFEIRVDESAGIVHLVLRGFWTLADLQAFGAQLLEAVGRAARHHAIFALVSDSTAFMIQSSEVGETFARMMGAGNRLHAGPTAIVVGSTLNKLQAERLLGGPRVRIFTDFDAAARWADAALAEARATKP